jgi:hypothetical protein
MSNSTRSDFFRNKITKCSECGFTDPDSKLFHDLDVNGKPEKLCNMCYGDYVQDQEDRYGEEQYV